MEKLTNKAREIMVERFGKDNVIALATTEKNPVVAIAGEWYTAHGKGVTYHRGEIQCVQIPVEQNRCATARAGHRAAILFNLNLSGRGRCVQI